MENMDSQTKQGQSGSSEREVLTDGDVSRIAEAVTQGIKDAKPEETASKVMWLVVTILLSAAIASGVWGFMTRPSQNGTFRGNFAIGTMVSIEASPALNQEVRGTISGLELKGHDQPIWLTLPIALEQRDALARAFDSVYRQGNPIEASVIGPRKLNFTQPVSVIINVEKTGVVSINRLSGEGGTALIQLEAKDAQPGADVSNGPVLNVRVIPPAKEAGFRVEESGKELGVFSLQPGLIASNSMVTLQLRTYPHKKEYGEVVGLSFPGKEPDFQALFSEVPGNYEDTRILGEQNIQINDTPGGVLALGSVTQTLAGGERLQIKLVRPEEIKIIENRITLDALRQSSVKDAVRNDVVNLLPLRYTLWPDWAQQLWRWGAITMGTGIFLILLRKFKLWPS